MNEVPLRWRAVLMDAPDLDETVIPGLRVDQLRELVDRLRLDATFLIMIDSETHEDLRMDLGATNTDLVVPTVMTSTTDGTVVLARPAGNDMLETERVLISSGVDQYEVPRHWAVPKSTAIELALWFMAHGEPHPAYPWADEKVPRPR